MALVVVTGGTGQLGRVLVPKLRANGHQVRVISRRARMTGDPDVDWATVDYRAGSGLDEALAGADVVVHTASGSPKGEREILAALLPALGRQATPPHVVYISIVGIDRLPLGYYRAKLAAEEGLASAGVPLTVLRSTQFHSLIVALLRGLAKLPLVMLLPKGLRFQPIALEPVAERLAELVESSPKGRVDDIGGPEVRTLRDLATAYLTASRRRRRILEVPLPGKLMAGLRAGANTTPEHLTPGQTFEQYLAEAADRG
jgi:uncharacterized protein YbjT (DUF2867 family)